jgi:pteridine reductase
VCANELKKNQGSIVNIADIHAEQGLRDYSVYTAAKAGLINFSKSLGKELAPDVLVNSVSPGAILWDVNEPSDEKKDEILASIPMKRIGDEKDIVSIINYLLTENTYMTGRNINIDGGKSLG